MQIVSENFNTLLLNLEKLLGAAPKEEIISVPKMNKEEGDMKIIEMPHPIVFIVKDTKTGLEEIKNYLGPKNAAFLEKEAEERLSGKEHNPGTAWRLDENRWASKLDADGQFDYTYSERMHTHFPFRGILSLFRQDTKSRRLFLPIWSGYDSTRMMEGDGRPIQVPCTIGFYLYYHGVWKEQKGYLVLTQVMRSLDLGGCVTNDLYLGARLLDYFATKLCIRKTELRLVALNPFYPIEGGNV